MGPKPHPARPAAAVASGAARRRRRLIRDMSETHADTLQHQRRNWSGSLAAALPREGFLTKAGRRHARGGGRHAAARLHERPRAVRERLAARADQSMPCFSSADISPKVSVAPVGHGTSGRSRSPASPRGGHDQRAEDAALEQFVVAVRPGDDERRHEMGAARSSGTVAPRRRARARPAPSRRRNPLPARPSRPRTGPAPPSSASTQSPESSAKAGSPPPAPRHAP